MKGKAVIQFLGAAGTVTGSKYLVSAFGKNILVDCGLFQGLKKLRLLNWQPLPIPTGKIDLVLLTHGHLDHVGYLPLLVRNGYAKPIWATSPTTKIAKIILEDSAKIQEEDAEKANRKGYSKHTPAKPLYNLKDVKKTIPLFAPQPLEEWIEIDKNFSCRFRYNGHIIGATFIELKIAGKLFVFSGDIGRDDDQLLYPPQRPEKADVLLIESTYGNRLHPKNTEEELASVINSAAEHKGIIIIPSFAVERTQSLMYILWQLRKQKRIVDLPVYMDSPMGANVLDLFHHHTDWHKLSSKECLLMCKDIKRVRTIEETQKLIRDKTPKVVIAGSGMVSGGRVLMYLKKYLSDPTTTILLVGYQAEGTRGRAMLEGAAEVKLEGEYYPVKAMIRNLEGLSAHTDQSGLLAWIKSIKNVPERIYVVHGELQSSDALRVKIKDERGWDCQIPELNQKVEIEV